MKTKLLFLLFLLWLPQTFLFSQVQNVTSGTTHTSLQSALLAASPNDSIVLLNNLSIGNSSLVINKKIILNGNNFEVELDGGVSPAWPNNFGFYIDNSAAGTSILNLQLLKSDNDNQTVLGIAADDVKLTNVKIVGQWSAGGNTEVTGIQIEDSLSGIVVRNCTISGVKNAALVQDATEAVLMNNTFNAAPLKLLANSKVSFKSNSNLVLNIIDGIPANFIDNWYSCPVIELIKLHNSSAVVNNPLIINSCSSSFITDWTATDSIITIPTTGGGYSYAMTWVDLSQPLFKIQKVDTLINGSVTLNQLTSGNNYRIVIHGDFPRIYFNNGTSKLKIKKIIQWGDIVWSEMTAAFYGCANLDIVATDVPDLSNVTQLSSMFRACSGLIGTNANWDWDLSNVESTKMMFYGASQFNQNIGNWNFSNVTNISGMFREASSFNRSIQYWDVSNVTDMSDLFYNANNFNKTLENWNVSNVLNMKNMFRGTQYFNQNIGDWDVSQVENMDNMFNGAMSFNQNLWNWNLAGLTSASGMFNVAANQGMDCENMGLSLLGWAFNPNTHDSVTIGVANRGIPSNFDVYINKLVDEKGWTFSGAFSNSCNSLNPFITEWSPKDSSIVIYTNNVGYNYFISWKNLNDSLDAGYFLNQKGNTIIEGLDNDAVYEVSILGKFPQFYISEAGGGTSMKEHLLKLKQWGDIEWRSLSSAFSGAINMEVMNLDVPNLTMVKSIAGMFYNTNFSGDDANWNWNTENIENMQSVFYNAAGFNGDISNWITSKVYTMASMFFKAKNFNQDISTWNTSQVQNMNQMFRDANSFSQNLGSWDLSSLDSALYMFDASYGFGMGCTHFSNTLLGWGENNSTPSGIALGARFRNRIEGSEEGLLNKNWTIQQMEGHCTALDIINPEKETTVHVYPNPSKGIVNIEAVFSKETNLKIIDVLGNVILENSFMTSNQEHRKVSIDLTNHAKGIYFIYLNNKVFKFVLE